MRSGRVRRPRTLSSPTCLARSVVSAAVILLSVWAAVMRFMIAPNACAGLTVASLAGAAGGGGGGGAASGEGGGAAGGAGGGGGDEGAGSAATGAPTGAG